MSRTEDYKILFGFTRKGFLKTYWKVNKFMVAVLPDNMGGDVLGSRSIADLTHNILKDVMSQTSSTLMKLCKHESSYSATQATQMGSDMAKKLVDSTAERMLEYWHLCNVSNWFTATSYNCRVDPNVMIDSLSSRMAKDALSSFLENLLSVCIGRKPHETWCIFVHSPMCRFVMDVAESAVGLLKPAETRVTYSEKRAAKMYGLFSTKEHLCEIILRAILRCADKEDEHDDYDQDAISDSKNDIKLIWRYWKTLKAESREFIRNSILDETSKIAASIPDPSALGCNQYAKLDRCASITSSEIVEMLTSELSFIVDKDVYPHHDKSAVERMSKALLKLTQDKLKEAIKTCLFMRSQQSVSDSQNALLRHGSERVVRRAVRDLKEFLGGFLLENIHASVPAKKFLKAMTRQLDFMARQSSSLLSRIKRRLRQLRNRARKKFGTKLTPLNFKSTTGVQESSPDPPTVSPPEEKQGVRRCKTF